MQLHRNLQQAVQADLVLVDSDDLHKFSRFKTRRFAYAVNERLFYPRPKEYDVAFLCWPTPERRAIQAACREICDRRGWKFLTSIYTDAQDYARAIGSAKVIVHKAHVERARSWRVFDVMASHGCLLTSPLPVVSGDGIKAGEHYQEYSGPDQLERRLLELLADDDWVKIAEAGYHHVLAQHTWSTRAAQLRQILAEEFKWV
jgi:glycosyltransferase involved in cell wall biosynthesis